MHYLSLIRICQYFINFRLCLLYLVTKNRYYVWSWQRANQSIHSIHVQHNSILTSNLFIQVSYIVVCCCLLQKQGYESCMLFILHFWYNMLFKWYWYFILQENFWTDDINTCNTSNWKRHSSIFWTVNTRVYFVGKVPMLLLTIWVHYSN